MAQIQIYKRKDIETIFRVFLCKHKQYEWFINHLCGDTIEKMVLNTHFRDYIIKIKNYDCHRDYEISKNLDGIWYGKLYSNDILRLI